MDKNGLALNIEQIPFFDVEVPVGADEDKNAAIPECQSRAMLSILRALGASWQDGQPAVKFKTFTNGITNHIVCAEKGGQRLVFRIFGKGTEVLVDRKNELENFLAFSRAGIGAGAMARFRNGIVAEYLPGQPISTAQIRQTHILEKVCEKMARMHRIRVISPECQEYAEKCRETASFSKLEKWLGQIGQERKAAKSTQTASKELPPNREDLARIFQLLRAKILAFRLPIVFSHNDLLGYNILLEEGHGQGEGGGGHIHFIDYEYAGPNFQLNDFGNLFWEYSESAKSATDEEIRHFLLAYFKYFDGKMTDANMIDERIHQVHCFEALTHLFWCVWALFQSEVSQLDFDYPSYAKLRHRRLLASLDRISGNWQQVLAELNISKMRGSTPAIQFVSTRGLAPALGFSDVLLTGLASDGGLYLPREYPQIGPAQLRALRGRPYSEVAFATMAPYIVGDSHVQASKLREMIGQAYGQFPHPAVCPLVQIGPNQFLLELFHGPTLAFKDIAMQLLAPLMDHVLAERGLSATILGATSGDTGSAAIHAFAGFGHVNVFILFPEGRVSPFQRRQMTTPTAPNVHALSIAGTFDDCQALVKQLFGDEAFRREKALCAVNSINWARIMAQVGYYFYAALALGAPERRVSFVVPTGNFGNIFAGYVAKKMGLPVDRLVVATNENDILTRALATGDYAVLPVRATPAPSMDIAVASNFERLLFEASQRNSGQVLKAMEALGAKGQFQIEPETLQRIRADFDAASATEAETSKAIGAVFAESSGNCQIDPHTAVGVKVGREILNGTSSINGKNAKAEQFSPEESPQIVLATAHPAKFPETMMAACGGHKPHLPPNYAGLMDESVPERCTKLPNRVEAVKAYIQGHSRVSGA